MAHFRFHPDLNRRAVGLLFAASLGAGWATAAAPAAGAEDFVYLVNVTMRPGYNFAGPDAALAYGHGICAKVDAGISYGRLIGEVEQDLHTTDEYQGTYLVTQAVNELCPESIWQLRNSAAGHRAGEVT